MLRGAIIGLGKVALEVHAPAWARHDVAIVAVSDTDPARRAVSAAALPAARWYDSADELLTREPLDFVDICTPPSTHAPLACRALDGGLHVFCEKPLVIGGDELDRISARAEASRRVVHTVHNWHHAPIIARATELVRAREIGHVTRVVWHTLRTQAAGAHNGIGSNWRLDPALAGGGILTDHGWHAFYLLGSWITETPTLLSARLERRRPGASLVEDTATVHLTFPDATAEIFLTWAADRRDNVAELIGTDGRITLQAETLTLERAGDVRRWTCAPALSNGSVHPDWFDPEIAQFLDAVTRTPPSSNLAEARMCGVLESLARESSRRGGQVMAVPSPRMPRG
jgi:predicted dehydrogenase